MQADIAEHTLGVGRRRCVPETPAICGLASNPWRVWVCAWPPLARLEGVRTGPCSFEQLCEPRHGPGPPALSDARVSVRMCRLLPCDEGKPDRPTCDAQGGLDSLGAVTQLPSFAAVVQFFKICRRFSPSSLSRNGRLASQANTFVHQAMWLYCAGWVSGNEECAAAGPLASLIR